MIREYLGRKAAETIDRTKFGGTKIGKISTVVLDDERLADIRHDGLISAGGDQTNPYLQYEMLVWAIIVNAISWLSVFVIPSVVSKLVIASALILPKGGMWLLAPVLGFTIVGVYSLLRIWFPERTYGPDDGVVMQSYGRDSESLRTYKLWLVSCGIGGINAILLAIVYLMISGDYEQYIRSRSL